MAINHLLKLIANIILDDERIKIFHPKVKISTRVASLTTSIYILLKALEKAVMQQQQQKNIEVIKEEIKLSLFLSNMILGIENSQKYLDIYKKI